MSAPVTQAAPGLRVEVATWRPVEVVEVDGWWVGRSDGFTRRGNSVAAVGRPADVEAALDRVEALYAERGLPPVVRVCGGSQPDDLDERLARRGYAVAATTLVLAAPLDEDAPGEASGEDGRPASDGPVGPPGRAVAVGDAPDEAWLRGWLEVKARVPVDLDLAARLVGSVPASYLRAVDDEGTLGVVRCAVAQGWGAISCLTVQPRARRQGLGAALTRQALALAREAGATAAFLQVEQANAGALALYEGLGFTAVDRYHYRERPLR